MPGAVESNLTYIRQSSGGPHSASHENGGSDEINVAALSGELADPQPPKAHVSDHENGGGDEINVAALSGELADGQKVKLNYVDKTHLSQDFGSSALRLHAWNLTPKQGKAFQASDGATSPFDGLIDAAGTGGLTSTNVPFDNETNLNCLKSLAAGATLWGRFVLHNSTRSNTRLVVDFDEINKNITTEASVDNWADNDVITLQSTTCVSAGFMDVDLSDEISSDEVIAYVQCEALDKSAGAQAGRRLMLHPFEAYNSGKRIMCPAALASEFTVVTALISIIGQKLCVFFDDFTDAALAVSVLATVEYADT